MDTRKTIKICKKCSCYLLDHSNPVLFIQGWKRCPSCGWSCDKEGYNLIEKKEENAPYEKNILCQSKGSNFKKDERNER